MKLHVINIIGVGRFRMSGAGGGGARGAKFSAGT